jgi:hypothetical protein
MERALLIGGMVLLAISALVGFDASLRQLPSQDG